MAASLMMPTAGAGAGHAGIAQVAAMSSKVLSGKYEVGMKLGEGLQGKVYMGKSRETGQLVALKCMDRCVPTRRVQKSLVTGRGCCARPRAVLASATCKP